MDVDAAGMSLFVDAAGGCGPTPAAGTATTALLAAAFVALAAGTPELSLAAASAASGVRLLMLSGIYHVDALLQVGPLLLASWHYCL